MTTHWTATALAQLATSQWPQAPLISAADIDEPIVPGHWLWDFWPAQLEDGSVAEVEGGALWFALSAPHSVDPLERHRVARIRLLHKGPGGWHDLGLAMPDGWSPGSREWSGSAVLRGRELTLWFTAAGRRGETTPSFEQRLFEAKARVEPGPRLEEWSPATELVASDGTMYDLAQAATGSVGTIKAFRDPAWFRDPADGKAWLLFTGSAAGSRHTHNGVIGIAEQVGSAWRLLPPLVSADGVNNELERPHLVVIGGRYHLFWSTQSSVFAPGVSAPTGLYGMVADQIKGPWRPLGGSGLLVANPVAAPDQAYSWLVGSDGSISSFVDVLPDGTFGGIFAPELSYFRL
ncbi:levansucrase [Polymorphobacter multimanifer]|uniref:Levansucrase n=1 Tax=Polymorphobacter multimanifer TaxID=1070431 RepID=A0A841LJ03_9SPHN|nr:glycoside hydrolase family 68 protein [Polymorphobacter multimanifer]MBB6228938.1 levansucrase [Polymorphobacter multimanifer]GGI73944.1 levansucrase [Polymorphobacter multimanifer]